MSKILKFAVLLTAVFLGSFVLVQAATTFYSNQVGTSPVNGYYLKTDGTNSTWAAVSGGGTGLSTTSPVSAGNLLVYSASGAGSAFGAATSTLTATSPLTGSFTHVGSTGSLGCKTASGSQAGCLSSTDWTTFNGKQAALGSLTGIIMGDAGSFYGTATSSAINMSITGNAGTVTNGIYTTDTGTVTNTMLAGSIANSKLLNSSLTVNGTAISLGGSGTITAASSTLLTDSNTFSGTSGNATTTITQDIHIGGVLSTGYHQLTGVFNGTYSTSDSVGGAVNWNFNGANDGFHIAGNSGGNLFNVDCYPSGAGSSQCVRIESTDTGNSVVNIQGKPTALGIVKISSSGDQGVNGSVLSLDASTNSNTGQALFAKCAAGNGACVHFTDSASNNIFSLLGGGYFGIASNTPTYALSVGSNFSVSSTTGNVVANGLTLANALPIASGGTNATSQSTNGVAYFDGTSLTSNSANLSYTSAGLGIPTGGLGVGGGAVNTTAIGIYGTWSNSLFNIAGNITGTGASAISMTPTINGSATVQQVGFNNTVIFQPTGASLSNDYGTLFIAKHDNSSANVTTANALFARLDTGAGYTGTITNGNMFIAGSPSILGSNPITNLTQIYGSFLINGTGTTTGTINNYHLRSGGGNSSAASGGTINNYGVYVQLDSGSGTGTNNNYGLYINGNGGASATNNYAIYSPSTANSYINGNLGIGTTSPGSLLSLGGIANFTIATSTFYGAGINLTSGCFAIGGTCIGGSSGSGIVGSGTTGQFPYYAANGTTLTATSSLFLAANGNVGIGSTTPWAALSVDTSAGTTNPFFSVGSSEAQTFLVNRASSAPIIVSFVSTGTTTWTVPAGVSSVSVLVVGGGGGGGGNIGGGGGGGDYQTNTTYSVTPGASITVAVGAGGSGGIGGTSGGSGVSSAFGTIISQGGGGGATVDTNGINGGSGGGAGGQDTGGTFAGGIATGVNGHNGGGSGSTASNGSGGGGGGSGSVGAQGKTTSTGNGGAGTSNSISGVSVTYSCGGGGGGWNVVGGVGGCSNAGSSVNGSSGGNAVANTGSGGAGGANGSQNGGAGGSGIVVISYIPAVGSVSIATTTQTNTFTVNGNSVFQAMAQQTVVAMYGLIGSIDYLFEKIDQVGHLVTGGPAPTVSSCGTSPTISGDDRTGTISTSGTVTSCTMTFANTYSGIPVCIVSDGANDNAWISAISTSAVTFSFNASLGTSKIFYICQQHQ